jgi:predicted lipoprotein
MLKRFLGILVVAFTVYACSSSEEEPSPLDSFDRGIMLTHLADNIIIPAHQDFMTKMSALKAAGEVFTTSPNQSHLEALRISWFNAYKNWQHIEMFNIGKAEELQYRFFMNVYPLTTSDLESNIANGSYDLESANNHDAQGFPALDYLLHGLGSSDAEILENYTTATNNGNYKKYITDVLNQMYSKTEAVVSDWATYRGDFVSSTSNTATSAVNKLVNDFIFYYEKGLRANKLGIPAGIFSDNELPEKVEAFYKKDISKELALASLNSVIDFFNGKNYSGSGSGSSFSEYLSNLERNDLSQSILNQFNAAKTQINTLDNNFYQQVNTNNTEMLRAYDELQKAVVLLKVDMLQALSINIDYVDGDGDG